MVVKLAPNIYHQFRELPVAQRIEAVAELGFDAVEWHFPYQLPLAELRNLCAANGVRVQAALTPVDWNKEIGIAGQPGREDDFKRAVDLALEYAAAVGFKVLHPGPGQIPRSVSRKRCIEVLEKNLDYLCEQARGMDLTIIIEGVARARFPRMILRTISDAPQVVRSVGRPNLTVCYDPFHLQMEEKGSLLQILDAYWPIVGYCQIRNAPTPHEPGVGELDLHAIIRAIDAHGYGGWIGLEFDPAFDSWTSLLWARTYGYPVRPREETSFATTKTPPVVRGERYANARTKS